MTESASEVRARLVAFFQRDLVGPAHGETEELEERPSLRYSAGVLFPRESVRDESTEAGGIAVDKSAASAAPDNAAPIDLSEQDVTDNSPKKDEAVDNLNDDTITLANTFRPSALGLSYCFAGAGRIEIRVSAAVYSMQTRELEGARTVRTWKRQALELAPATIDLSGEEGWRAHETDLTEGLRLRTVVRTKSGNHLCTTSLVNDTHEALKSAREFFQVGFTVRSVDGEHRFREYRRLVASSQDAEERTLAMLYRKRGVFAAGHGCAAEWDASESTASEVRTSVIPAVRVPPVVPTDTDAPFADMEFLSGKKADDEEIISALRELPTRYDAWIADRERELPGFPTEFTESAREHLALCKTASARIVDGISVLERDGHALHAFKLMNEAMLRQQWHARRRRKLSEPWVDPPTTYTSAAGERGFWRTFQIAFILMTLGGLVPDAASTARDLVDLIWFPTGGGKTEAYLGLSAFALFRRRLARSTNAGCTILMRYTLRLLTSQQFQRAASLICACELIRRANTKILGSEPFSIGLWVGQSLTPNTEKDARAKLNKMKRDDDAKNPFQLLACPWCGTDLNDRAKFGYVEERGRILFVCPSDKGQCAFADPNSPLPVCVVDESIYARPPSLLIGTVDKFAMLAWRPQARPLFGVGKNAPPDLIIQDELHLISGPLGSMVGLYEGAIDLLCRDKNNRGPKIIASTATIRRARLQCRALFDRDTAQFPPQGLDASDNFFAREITDADGRIYVGFLPTAASSPLTAQIRAVSALAQGLLVVAGNERPKLLDPYWTLVQYFSSLKELGRAATLVAADIPEYLPSMQRRYSVAPERKRRVIFTEEMTSRKNEAEIPHILRELEREYKGPDTERGNRPLDTLLATNMISVGVDVERLGLMMVVTQPKGTSEYIQASSRVGRSRGAPGLVVTLYNAGRPRDRSHYEQFRAYHDAFYRFVEPTSVTPYAVPALSRALHAVLVIVARHIAGIEEVDAFDSENSAFRAAVDFLRARVKRVDEEQVTAFDDWVERRVAEWERLQPQAWGDFGPPQDNFLMHPMGKSPPGGDFAHYREYWETPTSMRNVDAECQGAVVAYPEVD